MTTMAFPLSAGIIVMLSSSRRFFKASFCWRERLQIVGGLLYFRMFVTVARMDYLLLPGRSRIPDSILATIFGTGITYKSGITY
jgi:hypothetical protein